MSKLTIGKIRTSVGVRGYFKVLSFSGEFKHFQKLKGRDLEFSLNGKNRSYTVEDVKMSGTNLTMKVIGIDSPEEARKLSGAELVTDRANVSSLEKGEFYNIDLCGCKLVTGDGRDVGIVKRISENSLSDLLEVETEKGIRLIPFMNRYIGKVDIDAGTIELTEEWLLQ
jgi:16S rRNA processing protein RimM